MLHQDQKLKSKYNPMDVRPSFRHQYCGEYDLPSGKPSGYFRFPITSAEVEQLAGGEDLGRSQAKAFCKNESELMLWVALRRKYGVNYLAPVKWQFWLDDYKYEGVKEKDNTDEIKNEFYNGLQNLFEELNSKINDLKYQKEEKDFKKMFDSDLTTEETMV